MANAYWSATTLASMPSIAWGVQFFDGLVGTVGKTGTTYARAVRGGL